MRHTNVICRLPKKNVWNIANDAVLVRVILPRTNDPRSIRLYMFFSSRLMVSKKPARENRYRIFPTRGQSHITLSVTVQNAHLLFTCVMLTWLST